MYKFLIQTAELYFIDFNVRYFKRIHEKYILRQHIVKQIIVIYHVEILPRKII